MNRNKKTKAVKANKSINYIELHNNLKASDSLTNNSSKDENDSFR
jgi:pullulanase/glycogen debranching enzyme